MLTADATSMIASGPVPAPKRGASPANWLHPLLVDVLRGPRLDVVRAARLGTTRSAIGVLAFDGHASTPIVVLRRPVPARADRWFTSRWVDACGQARAMPKPIPAFADPRHLGARASAPVPTMDPNNITTDGIIASLNAGPNRPALVGYPPAGVRTTLSACPPAGITVRAGRIDIEVVATGLSGRSPNVVTSFMPVTPIMPNVRLTSE